MSMIMAMMMMYIAYWGDKRDMKICRMLYTITVRQKLTAPGTRKLE
jgi:hypothetical protein